MLRYFIPVLLLLTSCVSSGDLLDPRISDQIPDGAKKFTIVTNDKPENLYDSIIRIIKREGMRIEDSNPEEGYITTTGTDVGQGTIGRYSISILETENGSDAVVSGEWKPTAAMSTALTGSGSIDWSAAKYKHGRPGRVYAYGVKLFMDEFTVSFK